MKKPFVRKEGGSGINQGCWSTLSRLRNKAHTLCEVSYEEEWPITLVKIWSEGKSTT